MGGLAQQRYLQLYMVAWLREELVAKPGVKLNGGVRYEIREKKLDKTNTNLGNRNYQHNGSSRRADRFELETQVETNAGKAMEET